VPGSHGPLVLAAVYSAAVVLASLAGGWLPLIVRLTHTRMQVSMSLCGGLMLGIGLLHMLPHAFAALGSLDQAVIWMMGGLLTMFFLIRAFHFHQHEVAEPPHVHSAKCEPHSHHSPGQLSWMGVLLGLGIHTMLDGVALAASVAAEAQEGHAGLWGFGTFLAILLHKPLDTVPISILMRAQHAPRKLQHAVNFAFAALCPVGMALFFLGFSRFSELQMTIVGCALAFSAGVFVCISLSDLLPELEFHSHDRVKLSLALVIGVVAAYAIGYLEPEDAHESHAPHVHAHEEATGGGSQP
jgi:zinc and cadmium transporter